MRWSVALSQTGVPWYLGGNSQLVDKALQGAHDLLVTSNPIYQALAQSADVVSAGINAVANTDIQMSSNLGRAAENGDSKGVFIAAVTGPLQVGAAAGLAYAPGLVGGLLTSSGSAIPGLTAHGAKQAAERAFTPERIAQVMKGTPVDAMGRYGPQTRYTLGNNTIVIANTGRNAGKIISTYSNQTINDIKGYWSEVPR